MAKPCPSCNTNDGLCIEEAFDAEKGAYSLAGVQDKIAAKLKYRLYCEVCDFSIFGKIEDGYFVAEP